MLGSTRYTRKEKAGENPISPYSVGVESEARRADVDRELPQPSPDGPSDHHFALV